MCWCCLLRIWEGKTHLNLVDKGRKRSTGEETAKKQTGKAEEHKKLRKMSGRKVVKEQGMVVHVLNPAYLGGRGRRTVSSGSAQVKKVVRPCFKTK